MRGGSGAEKHPAARGAVIGFGSPVRVFGLRNNADYAVTVTCKTSVGWGAVSAPPAPASIASSGPMPVMYACVSCPIAANMARRPLLSSLTW